MSTTQPDKHQERVADATGRPGGSLRANTLGPAAIVFFVVAAASPLTGVAGGLPVSFGIGNGAGVPAMYLLATLVLLVFSVGYAAMSREMTNAGAFYAYIGRGIAPWAGIVAAFVALVSYLGMMIAVYALFGVATGGTLEAHWGWQVPWWVVSICAVVIVALFGHRQVDLSAKVLGTLMLLEVLAVLVVDIGIIAKGGATGINFDSFTWDTMWAGAPGVALLFGFASFVGYEATALYGEEVRDPKRTVAQATYAAVLLIGAFYVFTTWSFALSSEDIGGQSRELLMANAGPGLLFGNAGQYVGTSMVYLLELLLTTSLFAALVAFHNGISRYLFALSRERIFPPFLARTHPRHDSPHYASAFTAVGATVVLLVAALISLEPMAQLFSWSSAVGTLGVLLLQLATSLAVIMFFADRPGSAFLNTKLAPAVALLGLLFAVYLAVSNFSAFTGGSARESYLLMLIVPATILFGLVVSWVMMSKRPDIYREVGQDMR